MSKNIYYVPQSIRLVSGAFSYGNDVELNVDGRTIRRRVGYSSLDGLYVTIAGVKYGKTDFDASATLSDA